jgi:integrase
MSPSKLAKRVVIPYHTETTVCDEDDFGAVRVKLKDGSSYFKSAVWLCGLSTSEEKQKLPPTRVYTRYPIVLFSDGSPWHEANMWVRHKLNELPHSALITRNIGSTIDDLVSFLRFIEDEGANWSDFSSPFREHYPTYRFQAHLSTQVEANELSYKLAKRRIGTIVSLYRWLIDSVHFRPAHAPWQEKKVKLQIPSLHGGSLTISRSTTDLSIKGRPKPNPFDETIADGGELRPLPHIEQSWLIDALLHYGNYELLLMHLISISTGARMQTTMTLRRQHFWQIPETKSLLSTHNALNARENLHRYLACWVGPGTGVDTKFDQKYNLHIPFWLYEKVHTYVHSSKAISRRMGALGGDVAGQYLFLTKHKNPWYASKQILFSDEQSPIRRSHIVGGSASTLIRENIIPYIQSKNDSAFTYSFHDLRATFGMNEIDRLLDKPKDSRKPNGPRWTLADVLKWLMVRMNHSDISTTERYVRYRDRLALTRALQGAWEEDLMAKMNQYANSAEKMFFSNSAGDEN